MRQMVSKTPPSVIIRSKVGFSSTNLGASTVRFLFNRSITPSMEANFTRSEIGALVLLSSFQTSNCANNVSCSLEIFMLSNL